MDLELYTVVLVEGEEHTIQKHDSAYEDHTKPNRGRADCTKPNEIDQSLFLVRNDDHRHRHKMDTISNNTVSWS